MVNWVKVTIVAFAAVFALLIGVIAFLNLTDKGQEILVYLSKTFPNIKIEVKSSSLWSVGNKMMNDGRIEDAIECFEKAKKQDEESENVVVDVDGLLMLGNAYEAAGRIQDAADLYEAIYTETPSRSEAYVAHIRILQNSENDEDLVKEAHKSRKKGLRKRYL